MMKGNREKREKFTHEICMLRKDYARTVEVHCGVKYSVKYMYNEREKQYHIIKRNAVHENMKEGDGKIYTIEKEK